MQWASASGGKVDPMPDEHEIAVLLNEYVDGTIKPADARKLLDLLDQSGEHKDQLVLMAVAERLLRASSIPPITAKKVIGALPTPDKKTARTLLEEKDKFRHKPTKLKIRRETTTNQIKLTRYKSRNTARSGYGKNSIVSVLIGIAVIGAITYGTWWLFTNRPPRKTTSWQAVNNAPQGPSQPTPNPVPVRPEQAPTSTVTTHHTYEPPTPARPATQVPPNIPAPQSDGSTEDGFVPPPAGLRKRSSDSEMQPHRLTVDKHPATARTVFQSAPKSGVLIAKLKRGASHKWNATPNDVDTLLGELKHLMGLSYLSEDRTLEEIDADPAENPIVYVSGHYHFTFTQDEREKLRKFMLAGGMMVFNAGLSSKPFYDSSIRELQLIFPQNPPQPLNTDHPVFHSYFDLERVKYCSRMKSAGMIGSSPRFDGVTLNCRTMALVSRFGLSVGWEGISRDDYRAYVIEDARKLGINIVSYAIAQKAWLQAVPTVPSPAVERTTTDTLHVAQIIYDGEWKTRTMGLSLLLQTFNRKTDVKVTLAVKDMRLTDRGIFDAPILYITGHEDFYLSGKEAVRLREFLTKGGFLIAESCCGRGGFDKAFRAEMERVLPDRKMKRIPGNSTIYSIPNKLDRIGVTPSLSAKVGAAVWSPALEGIKLDDNYAVVYSRYGMAGGWEMSQNPYADGYDNVGAMKLGQNILMYAITH